MNAKNLSISSNEKLTLISNFSTMLAAGISILEVVESLKEDAKGNQKKLLQYLKEDLSQGKHVYITFSRFPNVFDKVIVNIIKAAEEAGTLDTTLRDLKDSIRKDIEFNDKVKSALIYPFVIMLVFFSVMILMLTFVIPRMSAVFLRLRVPLPLPTRILIIVSNALVHNTVLFIGSLVAVAALLFLVYKKNRLLLLNFLFSLPIISDLMRLIDLTRFSRSMYLLLAAGLTITNALDLTREIVLKKEIKKILNRAYETVISGKRMSDAFRVHKKIIPSIMVKIIEVGEKSGSLEKSMQEVAEYMDYAVSKKLSTLLILLEPIMLVLVGILVGGMMLAIIAPIYNIIGQIQR